MKSDFYDIYASAEERHWWFLWREGMIESLVRSLSPAPGTKIIDVGCGTGMMVEGLGGYGRTVGVELASEALAYCRKRGVPAVQGTVLSLPIRADAGEIIMSLDLIEHVDDDVAALREIRRILKPGGVVIITVPAFQILWSSHDEVNLHRRRYTTRQLRSAVEAAGFQTVRLTYTNTALFLPVLAFRMLKKVLRRGANGSTASEADIGHVPAPLNWLLLRLLRAETWAFGNMKRPFGVSILMVARKQDQSG